MIRWAAPGPYEVGFSTREGGVSEGAFASLNLGILTEDEAERVVENRRRLCAEMGADPERATMAWQRHSAEIRRATPRGIIRRTVFDPCDGLWSDEPGQPMLLLTADCLPIALVRANGREPAATVLHAGWRGLLAGIVESGVDALGGGPLAAAIGPAIGPCCYEVGEEVAAPFRATFGADVIQGRKLDLWSSAERALRAAGCASVERIDLCTSCREDLFFSHRRDRGKTGRQGVIAYVS